METFLDRPTVVLGTMTMSDNYRNFTSHDANFAEHADMIKLYANRVSAHHGTPILDTANYYRNESYLQLLVHSLNQDRDTPLDIHWASKANPWAENDFASGKFGGLARLDAQLSQSLTDCGVRKFHTYFLHAPDPDTCLEDTLLDISTSYRRERFDRWGLSNFSLEQCKRVSEICEGQGIIHPKVYQGMYNMFCREVQVIFPWVWAHDMSFWAYNPLIGGLVCKRPAPPPVLMSETLVPPWARPLFKLVARHCGLVGDEPGTRTPAYKGRFTNPIYQQIFLRNGLLRACNQVPSGIEGVRTALLWLRDCSLLGSSDKVVMGASSLSQLQSNLSTWVDDQELSLEMIQRINSAHNGIPKADRPSYWY